MEEVPRNKLQMPATNSFYLAYNCVIKDTSATAKLRGVFDVSGESSNEFWVNDHLIIEPQLQKDLFAILICFQFLQVAFSAETAKEKHQVPTDDDKKHCHMVLRKNSNDTELKIYRIKRVHYGVGSSLYH